MIKKLQVEKNPHTKINQTQRYTQWASIQLECPFIIGVVELHIGLFFYYQIIFMYFCPHHHHTHMGLKLEKHLLCFS